MDRKSRHTAALGKVAGDSHTLAIPGAQAGAELHRDRQAIRDEDQPPSHRLCSNQPVERTDRRARALQSMSSRYLTPAFPAHQRHLAATW